MWLRGCPASGREQRKEEAGLLLRQPRVPPAAAILLRSLLFASWERAPGSLGKRHGKKAAGRGLNASVSLLVLGVQLLLGKVSLWFVFCLYLPALFDFSLVFSPTGTNADLSPSDTRGSLKMLAG